MLMRVAVPLVTCCAMLAVISATAPGAAAKQTKIIAALQFAIPSEVVVPPPPTGSATITARLGIRGCFTSAWSNGKKVKCPGTVVQACTVGRPIRVRPYGLAPQFVTTVAGGSFSATIPHVFLDDQQVAMRVSSEPKRTKRFRISCFGSEEVVDVVDQGVG
jgi:hypothetical protein